MINHKTIVLYSKTNLFTRTFVKVRLWDAPCELINKLLPKKGTVLDLGCGDGIVTNFLALSHPNLKFLGIEINKNRIKHASQNLPNAKFVKANILVYKFPKSDVILMTHLLHHLPTRSDQEKLIKKSLKSLSKNGYLIITEISQKPLTKYIVTWLTDAFIVPILFEKRLYDFNFHYRKEKEWLLLLKKENLKVKTIKAAKDKPFSHVIFIAKK